MAKLPAFREKLAIEVLCAALLQGAGVYEGRK
jgi:hypothetical protein